MVSRREFLIQVLYKKTKYMVKAPLEQQKKSLIISIKEYISVDFYYAHELPLHCFSCNDWRASQL